MSRFLKRAFKMSSHFLRNWNYLHRKILACHCHSNAWKAKNSIEVNVPLKRESLKFNFGKLARFTDGCCTAQMGDTSVMVTAVSQQKQSTASFLPLLVDYRQKTAAAGRIPTNFLRRDLAPNEKEILTSRAIDRSIRPLFPKGFSYETQISCNLLAVDGIYDPDVISLNAASAALTISNIPWGGPVGAVRVGFLDGDPVINPTRKELSSSSLNLLVAGTDQNQVVMIEASANMLPLEDFMTALNAGMQEIQSIVEALKNLRKEFGKPKREIESRPHPTEEMMETTKLFIEAKLTDVLTDYSYHKVSRGIEMDSIQKEAFIKLKENYTDCDDSLIYEALNITSKDIFRNLILQTDKRCDGRNLTELRDISCSVDVYKPLHGSALFQRGQTQVLCTVAFDSLESALRSDDITGGIKEKNFMLHYEFPPYATNEIGRVGAYGRREIGHGALAEKSLRPVMPNDFPFTTRLTAEVLESNGSSSMASVCGGSLALMDAGVPITSAVAGVAMGLISVANPENPSEISEYKILTDIMGLEDYLGDMDFKIAGTCDGITAAQLDVKIPGLPLNVVLETFQQSSVARNKILSIMNDAIPICRQEKKDNWPVTETLEVPVHKISHFIGPGGYNIKNLRVKTGVQITAVESGVFSVFAPNSDAMDEAKEKIEKLLTEEKEPELRFGEIYKAKIVELREIGAMVTLYPTMKPVLLHNSQLDQRKIYHPSALGLEVGQEIQVKYFGRDPANGNMRISRKVLQTVPSPVVQNLMDQKG